MLYDRGGLLSEGGCSVYPWRPLICRLFGFAAVRDKRGAARMAICRKLKLSSAAMAKVAADMVKGGVIAPVFTDYSSRVYGLSPGGDIRRRPINEALARSLEHVMFRMSLLDGSSS